VDLAAAITAAWERRAALHADAELDAYRLFHGGQEGFAGLKIDRYGDAAFLTCKTDAAARLDEVVAALDACRRFPLLVARTRQDGPQLVRGQMPAEPLVVREHGLRFLIEPRRPANPGLFLDARPARAWIRANAAGRRVLNLFAFTGSLGVAAAVGGAREVVHVDSVVRALELCRANHALNGVPIDARSVARINVYQHLRKAQAGRQRFDAVIVDPPPLNEHALRSDRTPGGRGIAALAPLVARMLAPGGWLLFFLHHGERSRDELERELLAAAQVPLEVLWRGESGIDFPEADDTKRLRLTAFVRDG
jgi:23S rRNA (cytosine1962-C5)-methyltransferase